jgi:DHA2 family multidrug resistance protein
MAMSRQSKLIVFVAVLASLLEIIDTSIVNVAIPTMMGNLGATLEDISMVITGYAIANAIVLPLSAWLGQRIGRRQYYLGCIILFTLTSVACGLAPNLYTLIVFRILQGLAGGALLPTSQALIYEQFPKEKAGMAGAIFGMSVMIGPTLGPTLGGYLTDNLGWRSIFNINLPLGMLALFIGYLVIMNPEQSDKEKESAKAPIDTFGLMLLTLGIGCLQYTLERGESEDWFASHAILMTTMISTICLPLFVWWELRVKYPIINIRLFLDPIVTNGVLLMTGLGFFLYALIFVLPVFVARVFNYDATQTGMLFIPGSLLTAFMMPMIGRAMQTFNPKHLIFVGLVSIEICIWKLSQFSSLTSYNQLITTLYIRGFAMAFLFVPINSSILSQFKGVALGQVSGLMNLSRQLGGSIGIALVGTLLTMNTKQNYLDIATHVSALNQQTQSAMMGMQAGMASKMSEAIGGATPQQAALKSLYYRIQNQAFLLSFNQLMFTIGLIFLFVFIPLYRLKLRAKPTGPVDAH